MKQLFVGMLAALALCACSNREEALPEVTDSATSADNPKVYVVNLGMGGELIETSVAPLTRATSNDLYGLQVQSKKSGESSYTNYAYGVFDDPSKMSVSLLEGYTYNFICRKVVDGKNKIKGSDDGGYYSPFAQGGGAVKPNNKMIYSASDYLNNISNRNGNSWLKNNGIISRPNIDSYDGIYSNYNPANDTSHSLSIPMKRVVFGAKYVVTGISQGKVTIAMTDAPTVEIPYTSSSSDQSFTQEDIYTFYGYNSNWTNDDYSESVTTSITYTDDAGNTTALANQNFKFYRNKQTVVTINVNEGGTNPNPGATGTTISLDIETTAMSASGTNYTINGSTGGNN